MNFDDFDSPRRSNIFRHAGFRAGAVIGLVMSAVHWALLLTIGTDAPSYFFHLPAYFMAGRSAAQQHYNGQRDSVNHLSGVRAAGVGAAMVACLIIWFFDILFFIIGDALGWDVTFFPVNAYCLIVMDVLVAMGLGAWGGNTIVNKYRDSDG
jgi:hypothetical protein